MKDYLAEVTKVLRSSGPNPSSVLKHSVLRRAAEGFASCPCCATRALVDLVDYGLMMNQKMHESLRQVSSFLYLLPVYALTPSVFPGRIPPS